jgi:hypothetical protein
MPVSKQPYRDISVRTPLIHPFTFESLTPDEAQTLARICTHECPAASSFAEGICESLAEKGLIAGYGHGVWMPTRLGSAIIRRSRPQEGPADWPDFCRFMLGRRLPSERDGSGYRGGKVFNRLRHQPLAETTEGAVCARTQESTERQRRIQRSRRRNLINVIRELAGQDVRVPTSRSKFLGVPRVIISNVLAGECLSDADAREIESALNRPRGWMDVDHQPPR